MDIDEFDRKFFAHIGTPRHSGRYPYGSGDNPNQRHVDFLSQVDAMKKKGLSEAQIAEGIGLGPNGTAVLRARRSIATNELRKANQSEAKRLKDKGLSNVAIGERMGLRESSVRNLLNPSAQENTDKLQNTANFLKKQVEDKQYLDVGSGAEQFANVSRTQMNTAIALLKEQGYTMHYVKVQQLGTGKFTKLKVLASPETTYKEVIQNQEKIRGIAGYTEDQGRNFLGIEKPIDVSSSRVAVRYGPDGGADKDGVIELRRNVDDISLGASRYAQVRISVDGTHYLKGMAMYADDLPDGVDMRFNTNKTDKGDKLLAMKAQKDDKDNPFGSIIRQKHYIDSEGNRKLSALNIVGSEDPDGNRFAGEEGAWSNWSKSLSTQVLSKQSPVLAKQQLDLAFKAKQDEYNEILSLSNPTVKKKLLESFADGADASAVDLKAAALPRQATHVILPMNTMKETEIYAPNYRDGERVALVRYPHGGKFEIPELVVNNRVEEPNRLIKGAKDAVGINSKVAARLSGADFDGDTVLVIPNNDGKIKSESPLARLKGFDPQTEYPAYEGMPPMSARTKQLKMGDVSNLITDMTIKGANNNEIAAAVRHSMVVIDAEKHNLNWRQSAKDNNISELKKKYQGDSRAGASTLISRATSATRVNERVARSAKDGGPIDALTGERKYTDTGEFYVKPGYTTVSKTGKIREVPEEKVYRTTKSTKLAEASDAYSLSSGTPMESVYAEHSNRLKALANTARKSYLQTPNLEYSPSARKAYDPQYKSLQAKLNIALKNSPLERTAQVVANSIVKTKQQEEPDMDPAKLKKLKGQALNTARDRVGAKKQRIDITPEEWNAIQAGAISNNFLENVLRNTDLDKVKALATPRATVTMAPSRVALAKARLAAGHTQADVADSLGISTSTLSAALK